MKIAIVEDSRLARNELRMLLAEYVRHEVVGEAESMQSAISMIHAEKPDLLLLDIQLPDGDGFTLLESLNPVPLVIFTTAYDEYAVRAFQVSALDYLLKPVKAAALTSALTKAEGKLQDSSSGTKSLASRGQDHIFFRDGQRYHFVRLRDISLLEVEGNYTRVYYQARRALMPYTLAYLDERLEGSSFFRVSRQHIVNLDYVAGIEPWINDGLHISLMDGRQINVSRRQAAALRQLLAL